MHNVLQSNRCPDESPSKLPPQLVLPRPPFLPLPESKGAIIDSEIVRPRPRQRSRCMVHRYGGIIVYAVEFRPSGHPKFHVVVSRILFGLFSERVFLLVCISVESNLLSPREKKRGKIRNRSRESACSLSRRQLVRPRAHVREVSAVFLSVSKRG
ncbi:hypothetical protein BC629DRAFT_418253 [Irpex lacteus]|nr:hypothetical protein BC629DRAFT_418253 [Irpex lacteus]